MLIARAGIATAVLVAAATAALRRKAPGEKGTPRRLHFIRIIRSNRRLRANHKRLLTNSAPSRSVA